MAIKKDNNKREDDKGTFVQSIRRFTADEIESIEEIIDRRFSESKHIREVFSIWLDDEIERAIGKRVITAAGWALGAIVAAAATALVAWMIKGAPNGH